MFLLIYTANFIANAQHLMKVVDEIKQRKAENCPEKKSSVMQVKN